MAARELDRLALACALRTASDATFESVVKYLADRRENNLKGGKPLRGKTYNAVLSKVRSFFAFAARSGWILQDPTAGVDWSHEQDSEDGSRAFTASEIARVLAHAGMPNPSDRRRTTDRYYVYLLATATPLRRSTLARLEWPMFRTWVGGLEGQPIPMGELRLPRRAVKKAKRVQVVPLPRWAVEALVEWWHACGKPGQGRVFPRLPEHRTILDDAQAVGITRYTEEGGVGWNSFRKFYLTDMATRAMPAVLNELSGHQDIRTTLKFYVGQTRVQAAAAVAGLENPSIVNNFSGTRVSAQPGGTKASDRSGDKPKGQPSPHGADLTRGVEGGHDVVAEPDPDRPMPAPIDNSTLGPDRRRSGEVQRLPSVKDGRAFSDHRAVPSDPMGIRTPSGPGPAGVTREPNYRLLALRMACGLREVADAVVKVLEKNEELDRAGIDPAT